MIIIIVTRIRRSRLEMSLGWSVLLQASVWSTLLVCYMEEPYGHLMLEKMDGAQARTRVKGNLFSFVLPWEEIANCCKKAMDHQSQSQDGKNGAVMTTLSVAWPCP